MLWLENILIPINYFFHQPHLNADGFLLKNSSFLWKTAQLPVRSSTLLTDQLQTHDRIIYIILSRGLSEPSKRIDDISLRLVQYLI